eukprot:5609055-Amphidinium_carterae.2
MLLMQHAQIHRGGNCPWNRRRIVAVCAPLFSPPILRASLYDFSCYEYSERSTTFSGAREANTPIASSKTSILVQSFADRALVNC